MGRRREIRLWVVRAYVGQTCVETVEVWADSRLQACERGYEAFSEGLVYDYAKPHPYKRNEIAMNERPATAREVRAHIERYVETRLTLTAEHLFVQAVKEMLEAIPVAHVFCVLSIMQCNGILGGAQADIVEGLLKAYPEYRRSIQ